MGAVIFAGWLCGMTAVVWLALWLHRGSDRAWVPVEPRRPVPWGLVDVLLAVGLLVTFSAIAVAVIMQYPSGGSRGEVSSLTSAEPVFDEFAILAQSAVSLVVMAVSIAWMTVRHGATASDVGWVPTRFAQDVRLGIVGFLALAPPTYALQIVLVQDFESKHPLVELLRAHPRWELIAATVMAAVIVAPLTEEYLFRGLLQGWLERVATGRDSRHTLILGGRVEPDPCEALVESPERVVDTSTPTAFWPVVLSAMIFALMHISHGPDWVPLFFFALGLGYLYRQTHRLTPVIVVHFLLNACSVALLLIEILVRRSGG